MIKHCQRILNKAIVGLCRLSPTYSLAVVAQHDNKTRKKPHLSIYKVTAVLIGLMVQYTASASNTFFIGPVYIQMLGVIVAPLGAHIPGNTEVRILGGFTIPAGAVCTDTYYITTLKTVLDNNKGLLTVLTSAQITNQPVYLWLTDDSAYTAYPGRCSIVAAQLGN